MRVTYIDDSWVFHSIFLALREFRVTSDIGRGGKWTRALGKKIMEILKEFNLSFEDIVSVTSDAGSDIKSFISSHAKIWTWCVSHLLHRVAVDTWKLPSMKELVSGIRQVFNFVAGHCDLFSFFNENRDPDDPLGLKIYQKQRWLGLSDTLMRLCHHHNILKSVFNNTHTHLQENWNFFKNIKPYLPGFRKFLNWPRTGSRIVARF